MHPVPNLIAIYAFIVMGVGYIITIFRIVGKEGGLWGKPSINPFLFNSGKIAQFICWGLALLKAIFPFFGWVDVPLWMSWFGSCMLCVATVVLLLSFYGLGSALRYGLPEKDTVKNIRIISIQQASPVFGSVTGDSFLHHFLSKHSEYFHWFVLYRDTLPNDFGGRKIFIRKIWC